MEQPIKLKDYEEIYFKMISIINSCDSPMQLKFLGDNLAKIYSKSKFKDKPSKKELESKTYHLLDTIQKKKDTLRRRLCDERKKAATDGKI